MKHLGPLLALLLLLPFFVSLAPMAAAAPSAPGGLRALVLGADDPQFIEFRFPLASDDPDQDVGRYQYNLTLDAGTPIDLGNVTGLQSYSAANGLVTVVLQLSGPSIVANYTIHAWDGVDEGPASCTVTVDSGIESDYDSCGAMDPTYQQVFCPPRAGDETIGYAVAAGVSATTESLKFQVRESWNGASPGKGAYVGLNLGGDTTEFRLPFTLRASSEGTYSRTLLFFSEVDTDATSTSVADGEDSGGQSTTFHLPTRGAFASGIAVVFQEVGNDWEIRIHQNLNGDTYQLYTNNAWTTDLHSNIFAEGELVISTYQGVIKVSLGGESIVISMTPGTFPTAAVPGNFHSHWITEYGSGLLKKGITYYKRTGDNLCLFSLGPSLGGAEAGIGSPSQGQSLEDFDGQGGALGEPAFPGMNVPNAAQHFGLEPVVFGWILAAMTLMGFVVAGYQYGRMPGAGVGALAGIPVAVFLNQMPLWFVVIIFLIAASLTVVFWGRG